MTDPPSYGEIRGLSKRGSTPKKSSAFSARDLTPYGSNFVQATSAVTATAAAAKPTFSPVVNSFWFSARFSDVFVNYLYQL